MGTKIAWRKIVALVSFILTCYDVEYSVLPYIFFPNIFGPNFAKNNDIKTVYFLGL